MTNQEIKDTGLLIKNEQHIGGNTAGRVGGVIEGIGYALDNKDAANGYYQATINGGSISVNAPNYVLGTSGNLRLKMLAAGTTASTLTIGNANAVQLLYNGAAVSAQNTWEQGEIISVFYDGTRFMASNSQGGGGNADKINYDNSASGLTANKVQGALDEVSYYEHNIALIQGSNYPFSHRSYAGLSAGTIYYIDSTNRLMIELPTEYLKSCKIKDSSYVIRTIILHQYSLPTNVFSLFDATATPSVFDGVSFDFESAVDGISSFDAKRAIIVLYKNNADLSNITSVDNIIGFELKDDVHISKNDSKILKNTSNISLISGIGTPFAIGSYKGELANYIQYTDNANRLRVELPLYDNVKLYIKDSSYMFQAFLLLNQVPTSDWYQGSSYIIDSNVIYTQSVSSQTGVYKKMLVVIRKTDNSNIDPTITSIDNILGVESVYGVPAYNGRITKKLRMMGGPLSTTHGLYAMALPIGYAHTPKFIKISGKVTIKTLELHGYICWYDENQTFMFYTEFNTLSSISTLTPPNGAKLFRISINGRDGGIVKDSIEIECDGLGYSEEFQKLPTDSGYQNVTFVVDVDTCIQPSSTNSELTRQYTKSTDSGVLHLPSNYCHAGKPTPLIIFIHGQADRYTNTSTRFSSDNRYAPEWDAAGYAQLDIDLIPDMYNYTGTDFADTSDDVACIEGAYEWVINHFNIARDGVYLMGRSRGAQAVMQVLGHYNANKLPVLAAISNAGANALVNYELYRNSSAAEWTLFCTAFGLPSSGRPSYKSKSRNNVGALISNSNIADFLRDNIDIWWDKSLMGLPLLEEYPEIPADPNRTYPSDKNDFHLKLFDLIVRSFKLNTTDANYGKEYCEWLNQCVMRSPVPLRFDWCNGDQTQQNWDDSHYNYAYYCVKACLNDRIGGKSVFRYWPEAGVNKPAGETTTNPHWHEYMNYVNGNFTLSDGITISNPSMARLEWLLWCQRYDRRYNGSINPT